MFNPEAFLNETIKAATSTAYVNVPEGQYPGSYIESLQTKTVNTKDGPRVILECLWNISDPDGKLKATTGREKNIVSQSLWLDLDEHTGKLAVGPGCNVGLGLTREALNQNKEGQAWNPNMMIGVPATPEVQHDMSGDKVYARVKNVFKYA